MDYLMVKAYYGIFNDPIETNDYGELRWYQHKLYFIVTNINGYLSLKRVVYLCNKRKGRMISKIINSFFLRRNTHFSVDFLDKLDII